MSERTLSVLDGSTFVVGDRLGDVRADEGREHGFFCDDTRFVSRWVLHVGEAPLELLGLDQSAHFAAQFFLTPRVGPDEEAPCSIMRRRLDRPRVDGGDHGDQPPPRAQRGAGGAGGRRRLRRPVRGQGRRGRQAGGELPPRRRGPHVRLRARGLPALGHNRRQPHGGGHPPGLRLLAAARARRAVVDHLHRHAPRRTAGGRLRAARAAWQPDAAERLQVGRARAVAGRGAGAGDPGHGAGAHLPREPQRSRRAAAAPRSQRGRDPPRGGAAVVHGALRPRQPDHQLPGAALPARAGRHHPARARRPPGRGARRLPRAGAGQDPARAALRRAHRAR